jgi:1,2-phenylacetyl-CoA epoxidase catalytic subunit
MVRQALKSGELTPEKYTELHEKNYGPLAEFMPEKVREATSHLELLKRYVEETGEKIEKKEELSKVKERYPEEWAKVEKAEAYKKELWDKLPEDFRYNRGINEYTTEELEAEIAEHEGIKPGWAPTEEEIRGEQPGKNRSPKINRIRIIKREK